MNFALVAAVSENWAIGRAGALPWPRLRGDMRRFKSVTAGGTVVMGRKTWDSLPARPLPGRTNIVLSTSMRPGAGYTVARSFSDVRGPAFVIGGARVYEEALAAGASIVHLTRVAGEFEGDVFFPALPGSWLEEAVGSEVDEATGLQLVFSVLTRVA